MDLQIFCLRERPDLVPLVFSGGLDAVWPEYMQHDAAAQLYFGRSVFHNYLDYAFAGLVDGKVVGRAFAVPFAFGIEGRTELPDSGWDQVIRWAHEDRLIGRAPTTMSALEIAFLPKARGRGHSLAMLDAFKSCAGKMGFTEMFAPVRPTQKHLQPRTAMHDYINMVGADGLPVDAWLRTHIAVGGSIVKVAPCSMTIVGTIAEWTHWTGRTFERSGETEIAGALAPVLISIEQDYGVYVEPNVWVRHSLRPGDGSRPDSIPVWIHPIG
jgi:GNAT superfamily N-acetyltransferase